MFGTGALQGKRKFVPSFKWDHRPWIAAEASIAFNKNLTIQPFSSMFGWIKKKIKCPKTALTEASGSDCINSNNKGIV